VYGLEPDISMLVVEPVQAAIWHCLNHYDFSDATFLAEKLLAESESEEAVFLVATCYYRQGRADQAHHLLSKHGASTPSSRFLLAKCSADLKKDGDAETAIRGHVVDPRKEVSLEEIIAAFGDKAVFALQILSKIYRKNQRDEKASEIDKKILKLNPLLWSSFHSLCSAGVSVDPDTIWETESLESLDHCTGANPIMNLVNLASNPPTVPSYVVNPTPGKQFNKMSSPSVTVMDSNGLETPLLYCNSISTPGQLVSTPGQMSGISILNSTGESDISNLKPTAPFVPPLLRPKIKQRIGKQSYNSIGSFSASFGLIGQSPSLHPGVAAKLLEFSSPQVVYLSPSPQTPSPSPILNHKSSLSSSPAVVPLRSSTPGVPNSSDEVMRPVKRVAMANKPDNTVLGGQQVLSHANMITPSPVNPVRRRSERLFGSTQSVKENSKGLGKGRNKNKPRTKSERQLSENELNEKNSRDSLKEKEKLSILDSDSKPPLREIHKSETVNNINLTLEAAKMQKSSVSGLLTLLKRLGQAYQKLCQYNCRESIQLFENLSSAHSSSNLVLGLLGKCYFELGEYKKCVQYFEEVREKDPFRLEMLEYYSTALWHLGSEVSLSSLAQDLQRIDKQSPITWCAAGNCFSHQKEHENAIKFFQRAVQVNPNFAYAYTLLGHEYVLIEELEKALSCFRSAVRIDNRHYNAWYGIGMTYYKQERFQLAETYYRLALGINKFSPMLLCHVAVVMHATNNSEGALDILDQAISMAPKTPLLKFERASILFNVEKYQEALDELMELKLIVPKESTVYFLIGKVHNKLGNIHLSLMNFSWAMDLDPKGANSQIKEALDPALNRQVQEMGNTTDDQGEPMMADNDSRHQDFQGDISEQFNPIIGENSETSSLAGVSPSRMMREDVEARESVNIIMADSDDSL